MKVFTCFITFLFIIFSSCNSGKNSEFINFEINNFNVLSNFKSDNDTVTIPIDLSEAVIQGITIPSKNQCDNGYFNFNFRIINKSNKAAIFYYKIFYQNESYKYNEIIKNSYNILSGNNFYGSWENFPDSFHVTNLIPNDKNSYIITDSFRIIGNPRNEQKYFGSETSNQGISDIRINRKIADILKNPEWVDQIKDKSVKNNVTVEEQLYRDALWVINDDQQHGDANNRWKRNPRVGSYSFVIAVIPEEELEKTPESIKYISKIEDGQFKNPYFDLLYNNALDNEKQIEVLKSKTVLKTYAKLNLGSGIYINRLKCNKFNFDTSNYSNNCGSSNTIYIDAQFEQLINDVNQNIKLNNIPIAYDVAENNYTQNEYNKNTNKYKPKEYITDFIHTTDRPCETVVSDTILNTLIIKNPGCKLNDLKKEDVGIYSRIGFTYGKYFAKIKFPSIISKENVWNGVTCAFWLKFQDENEWNFRSICDKSGYLSKSDNGPHTPRYKTTYYSEIDFEILKTSEFWPKTSYSKHSIIPVDDPKSNHDIIVTCTNWDLACRMPENFSVGAKDFINGTKKYTVHRWDDWYKALTTKFAVNHDSIFNRPYYYEIDWQPDKIIWRIGSSKDKMIEIGYMDNTITTIPDNQMVLVFSQQFHDSKWWPLSPFIQDMIPFPKNDIVSEIYEVEVE
jgi:hypothetical protein